MFVDDVEIDVYTCCYVRVLLQQVARSIAQGIYEREP